MMSDWTPTGRFKLNPHWAHWDRSSVTHMYAAMFNGLLLQEFKRDVQEYKLDSNSSETYAKKVLKMLHTEPVWEFEWRDVEVVDE